jgi:formylglycine-generating enzyme required for sulfatase activity
MSVATLRAVFQAAVLPLLALWSGEPPAHKWALQEGRHWQVVSETSEHPDLTAAVEANGGSCPVGMVEVRGKMRLDGHAGSIDAMQKLACTRWISVEFPERCAEFDAEQWRAYVAELPTVEMSFCIDRYEYPNVKGQFPWVFVTWTEAAEICESGGKRLCSEMEWTFACEGEDALPYPYGFERSEAACVIDRPWKEPDERRFDDRTSDSALHELDRVWQGEACGSRPACRSAFGVYDMTGNVDEWTYSTASQGVRSILKGGYWGEVRARCRPSTRVHGENFAYYQQGFRCCTDALPP